MVAVLTRLFGVHNLALAEDVVQDAFCRALEVWQYRGLPDNPAAWLMAAAKHRALDVLRRDRTARRFAPELSQRLESEWTLVPTLEERFTAHAISDDLLRMMFSCCHPGLKEEAQVMLVLHLLCGFSVAEVAGAFVATHAAVEKRLTRSKKVLAASKELFDVTRADELAARLPAVHRALYLLFNEGYHGASAQVAVRAELCREALRLLELLREHPVGRTPATFALSALLSLHAARLPARLDAEGELHSLFEQDRSRWDQRLIAEGWSLLEQAAGGPELTDYHLEAAIAWFHAKAPSIEATEWSNIVKVYDRLLELRPSPVVALNRAIALAQAEGPEQGLEAIRAIEGRERLDHYPFYAAALGELELRAGRSELAAGHFQEAMTLARNPSERRFFEQRIGACSV
jgi:RNA polymerase sigma-70 factor (ECF subfamily)